MPNKKERDRVKRKRKQHELRKRKAKMQYQAIADPRQPLTCRINVDWKKKGMANIFVLKELRGGGYALGAFLVDLWCCGLKDAWGQLQFTSEQFRLMLKRAEADRDYRHEEVDVETARRVILGGIRFAVQNEFRLPPHFERWVSMLGVDPKAADADLSDFGFEGKLQYMGSMEDLRRRLIRQSVDDFLARPDVVHTTMDENGGSDEEGEYGEDEDDVDDDDAEEEDEPFDANDFREATALSARRFAEIVRQGCVARGVAPAAQLDQAALAIMTAMFQTALTPADGDADATSGGVPPRERVLAQAMESVPEEERPGLQEAIAQIADFTKSSSIKTFLSKLGRHPE
jgi:hypothetical protein